MSRRLTRTVQLRFGDEQYDQLRELAEAEDVSIGQVVRDLVATGMAASTGGGLSSVEFDRVNDRVVATVRLVGGTCIAAAFDLEQVEAMADEALQATREPA